MRVHSDLRRCVAFIGYRGDDSNGGIQPIGSGFFLTFERRPYFVTAQHIAVAIGDNPFVIRLNTPNGDSTTFHIDPLQNNFEWLTKENEDVDIAVMAFNAPQELIDSTSILSVPDIMIGIEPGASYDVDIGDMTYSIGLFRLMAGKRRNLPIVHCGNIALMAGEEPIAVEDWLAPPDSGKSRLIEAYLVEQQSLQGLSGSPVFVRPPVNVLWPMPKGEGKNVLLPTRELKLLGVWQGAWDASPDKVLAAGQRGRVVRVPVGMGVVSPVYKLREILMKPKVVAERALHNKQGDAQNLSKSDSISLPEKEAAVVLEPDNPAHKEDFMSLLGAAAKGRSPKDQT